MDIVDNDGLYWRIWVNHGCMIMAMNVDQWHGQQRYHQTWQAGKFTKNRGVLLEHRP